MLRARGVLKLVLLVLTLSAAAFADDYEQALTTALEARDRALETGAEEDWRLALEGLRHAAALQDSKEIRFEVARALARLGLDDQAVEAYRDVIGVGLNERAEREAQSFIDARSPRMASLNVEGPQGGEVYVRGEKRGTLPLARPLVVVAGGFEIRVERPGEEPLVEKVDVPEGAARTVTMGLDTRVQVAEPAAKEARAPERTTGAAEPASNWGTPVFFAGGGLTIASVGVVVASSLMLESERDGLKDVCAELEDDVCVAATEENQSVAQDHVDAIETQKAVRTAGYVALGVGAVTAAVGLYGVLSASPNRRESGRARARFTRSGATFEWALRF